MSVWRALAALLCCLLGGARPVARSPIAVIQAVESCAPADRAYAASRARYVVDGLASGGVKADLSADKALDAVLSGRRLAYLVTMQKPSPAHMAALDRFRARGGKVAVLQSYSSDLASRLGVAVEGVSRRRGKVRVRPFKGGWWLGNYFSSDETEEERARQLLALAEQAVPGVWDAAAWEAKRQTRLAADRAYGAKQTPRPGEIHAVWDHSGEGLYPGDWPRTMRMLQANRITDLFVNVAGAGFGHYPSKVLPASATLTAAGDQLSSCLAAARGTGIRVHAWVLCFNATRASPAKKAAFAKKGWLLKDVQGRVTDYLNPTHADLRQYLLATIDELAGNYAVSGIHLDFVRWYEKATGKPKRPDRAITTFVEAVRQRVRAVRPGAILSAAVLGNYPSCVTSVGQDWKAWIDAGLVDYVVPMNYVPDTPRLAALVQKQGLTRAQARHVIGGIGVTANESTLTPRQVVDQINFSRQAGFAGVALFDLDATLATRVLPILRLGLFK
ncbi:MAG: glycoside hydrolase family 10 protein [Kiritimatiellia bacterium]